MLLVQPFTAVLSHFGNIQFQLKLRKHAGSELLKFYFVSVILNLIIYSWMQNIGSLNIGVVY